MGNTNSPSLNNTSPPQPPPRVDVGNNTSTREITSLTDLITVIFTSPPREPGMDDKTRP